MAFLIEVPETYGPEREYIIGVLFGDFLGQQFTISHSARGVARCSLEGSDASIIWPDYLFATTPENWLSADSIPALPLPMWNYTASGLPPDRRISEPVPLIYGNIEAPSGIPPNTTYFPVDLLGSSFFMLSRYEEVAAPAADKHSRYPAEASLASRGGFLNRPIVHEYIELFWAMCKRIWPQLIRTPSIGRLWVTCDVDFPRSPRRIDQALRTIAADLIRRKSPSLAAKRIGGYLASSRLDPNNSFDWIMNECEKAGRSATFFFITDQLSREYDTDYTVDERFILLLMSKLNQRGHEIGLHGSYLSFDDGNQIRREVERLKHAMARAGVNQPMIGGRQHFLRWKTPTTARILSEASLKYDSTLGFAQQPGYRTGACMSYRMFDILDRSTLNVVQRPLIVMDVSIFGREYLSLPLNSDTLGKIERYKEQTLSFGGEFALLWHNNYLSHPDEQEFFKGLIS